MTGAELTVVGWFATSIIRNIMGAASSVLGSNNALGSQTAQSLIDLESSLPLIRATIERASKDPIENEGLINWLHNLRIKAYKVRDVLDDLQAKSFRQSSKGKTEVTKLLHKLGNKIKPLILSDKELKAFKSVVDEFNTFARRVDIFIKIWEHEKPSEPTDTNKWETSATLERNKDIFGRDIEIDFILAMISNQLITFPQENSDKREEKGNTGEIHDQNIGNIKLTVEKGNTSSVQITKGSEVEIESMFREMTTRESNVQTLFIENWKLPVLPIYGIGGVGKTTIAKMVYNSYIAQEVFDNLRIWVYVSQKPDIKKILTKIALEFGDRIDSTMYLDTIEKILKKANKNRRFFLVLDDVYDGIESIWDDLFKVLNNIAQPGSFVLVTTQSEHVANTVGNLSNIIRLGVLEPKWFDILFKHFAFGKLFKFHWQIGKYSISVTNNAEAQFCGLSEKDLSVLESIATDIAKKLHGLPLAGEVIGKMLNNKELNITEWEDILKSNWWELDVERKILSFLSIGYEGLNLELKRCFEFCSIFPKNYEFDRDRLVQMWMAHEFDFFQPNQNEIGSRLEDVGGKRFDELVKRSFFSGNN